MVTMTSNDASDALGLGREAASSRKQASDRLSGDFKRFMDRYGKDAVTSGGKSAAVDYPTGRKGFVDQDVEMGPVGLFDDLTEDDDRVEVDNAIFIGIDDHDALVVHIRTLLDRCNAASRLRRLQRHARVDRAYEAVSSNGLPCDDEDTIKDNSPTNNHNEYLVLPIAQAKVIDTANIYANILFPPTGMYSTISNKDNTAAARAVASSMNRDASKFGHFPACFMATLNLVKYNMAGMKVTWDKMRGQVVSKGDGQAQPRFTDGVVYEGCRITSVDPNNVFWDTTLPNLSELGSKGEFVATSSYESIFRLRWLSRRRELFGSTNLGLATRGSGYYSDYTGYYTHKPVQMYDYAEMKNATGSFKQADTAVDWSVHAGVADIYGGAVQIAQFGAAEVIDVYIRLDAADFGLPTATQDMPETSAGTTDKDAVSIWHIKILNGKRIILARREDTPHGQLPIQLTMLNQMDTTNNSEKSLAELIIPFQNHMQDILNKLQLSQKKGILGGLTFYNPNIVDIKPNQNPLSGFIPTKNLPADADIRSHLLQLNGAPDTQRNLEHIASLQAMLEDIAPSKMAQQVADLQRATEFQAAATVAAGAKRHLTAAKIIDDALFMPIRQMMYAMMLTNNTVLDVIDEHGQPKQVTPNDIIDAKIEFDIASGLLGMDRLIMANHLYQIINMLIQSNLSAQYDMAALIDYYTAMLGDRTDFRQFRLASPFDALPPDQKQAAMDALQQVAAQGGQKPPQPNQGARTTEATQ